MGFPRGFPEGEARGRDEGRIGLGEKIKICLDAGHYGKYNRSPAVPEYYESDMNWKLHRLLKKYLEGYGFEVTVTRAKKAVDRALFERGSSSKGCELFLSLHSNAAGSKVDESVDRVDVFCPLSGAGRDIARKLADCIAQIMDTKQPGYVKTRKGAGGRDYYGVIRGAAAVGVAGLLVEHSFHTCTRSAKWLMDDGNLDRLARAEAKVLAEHYGILPGASREPCKMGDRSLKRGMSGSDVAELKAALIRLGYDAAGDAFDEAAENAVNRFKEDCGLEPNGRAGAKAFRKIWELLGEEQKDVGQDS